MFNINFYDFACTDVRRDEPELDLDTPLENLFEFLTEDMLLVNFKKFFLDISCYGYVDAWNDRNNYSINTFKKIIFTVNLISKKNGSWQNPDICIVARYLPELKESIFKALEFLGNTPYGNTIGLFDIDFYPGYIVTNRPQINFDISFEYLYLLIRHQTILKVIFPQKIILESGWICLDKELMYDKENWNESIFENGYFWIKAIKENNFENPIFDLKCKNLTDLRLNLLEALKQIKELL